MISFLNDKFKQVGKKNFLLKASVLCLISDIGNILYLNMFWFKKKLTIPFLANIMSIQGVNLYQFPQADILAIKMMLVGAFSTMFYIFLIYHCFVYFKMAKDKKWAKKYVHGYALTGAILTLLEIPSLFSASFFWAIIMIMTTIIYIYSFLGIRYFKKIEAQ